MTLHIIVMGVSGCGKSTVGTLLAQRMGGAFTDADDLHPPANVSKMASGIPLNDQDREPWLRTVGSHLASCSNPAAVIACSALKRSYRDLIREAAPEAHFIHLRGDRTLLAARMSAREAHFMPLSLLDSQLATLEDLYPDEEGHTFDIAESPEHIADRAFRLLMEGSLGQ